MMSANNLRRIAILSIVTVLILIVCISPVIASDDEHSNHINSLVKNKKYESAAAYIKDNNLLNEPRFIRTYTHILTNYYVYSISFNIFALKDLEINENVEDYRGKQGEYKMIGSSLEKLLFDNYNEKPDSPDINYAVGEYLARGEICGCGQPVLFSGDKKNDYHYLLKAYEGGVYDYWSLFRLGYLIHRDPSSDLNKAAFFYEKSLELKKDHVPAAYNLAGLALAQNNIEKARKYAKQALGKYDDNELNADTYYLYGEVEYQAGKTDIAQANFIKALELKNWHASAFTRLIHIFRTQNLKDKYIEEVKKYIALDYSNTYPFNIYVDYLANAGVNEYDKEIISFLAENQYDSKLEEGAVHFNLGKLSEYADNNDQALKFYTKSLNAMKTLENPPTGAIDALNMAIERITNKDK